MGGLEIQLLMSYLVSERKFAGATYTHALCALSFLYKKALNVDVPWIDGISLPKKAGQAPNRADIAGNRAGVSPNGRRLCFDRAAAVWNGVNGD